jgi:hypothetical protein
LNRPSEADGKWFRDALDRMSAPHGTHLDLMPGGTLTIHWT